MALDVADPPHERLNRAEAEAAVVVVVALGADFYRAGRIGSETTG